MINSGIILVSLFLISLAGNAVEIIYIKSLKKDLTGTKTGLYDCLAENKKNEGLLNEIENNNKKITNKLSSTEKKYHDAMAKTSHEINAVLLTPVSDDCEKAIKWGAENSAKASQNF